MLAEEDGDMSRREFGVMRENGQAKSEITTTGCDFKNVKHKFEKDVSILGSHFAPTIGGKTRWSILVAIDAKQLQIAADPASHCGPNRRA